MIIRHKSELPKQVIAINRQVQNLKEKLQLEKLGERLKRAKQRNAEFEKQINNTNF